MSVWIVEDFPAFHFESLYHTLLLLTFLSEIHSCIRGTAPHCVSHSPALSDILPNCPTLSLTVLQVQLSCSAPNSQLTVGKCTIQCTAGWNLDSQESSANFGETGADPCFFSHCFEIVSSIFYYLSPVNWGKYTRYA